MAMTREQKGQVIKDLTAQLNDNSIIYLADISTLNAGSTSDLRRACFKANVKLNVVKNTLLAKAMENTEKDFGGLSEVLKGNTSIMISETGNAPAKVIKASAKDAKLSLDGKTIEIERSFLAYLKNPDILDLGSGAVSYTHLTLPTICSV